MTPKSPKHGDKLEIATAAYFQSHGLLVRRSVRLAVAAGTAEATDIDLLGLRYSNPLNEERIIVDCRDRRKPRPFERILWTLGLATFSKANRATVVSPRAPWQAREFASQATVEILDADQIYSHLDNRKNSYIPFGDASQTLELKTQDRKKRCGSAAKGLLQETTRIRQMLIIGHPLSNFIRIIRILSEIGKFNPQNPEMKYLVHYTLFDAAVIIATMLSRFSAETKWTPKTSRTDYARKKLTYGDTPPGKAQELAKIAMGQTFHNVFPPPKFADETILLIDSLVENSLLAAKMPYAADYLLFGRVLEGIPDSHVVPYLGAEQDDAIKMVKKLLSLLSFAAEIPNSIWEFRNEEYVTKNDASQRNLL
jgi:hypothetical protein